MDDACFYFVFSGGPLADHCSAITLARAAVDEIVSQATLPGRSAEEQAEECRDELVEALLAIDLDTVTPRQAFQICTLSLCLACALGQIESVLSQAGLAMWVERTQQQIAEDKPLLRVQGLTTAMVEDVFRALHDHGAEYRDLSTEIPATQGATIH
jgi:hypothetical protein